MRPNSWCSRRGTYFLLNGHLLDFHSANISCVLEHRGFPIAIASTQTLQVYFVWRIIWERGKTKVDLFIGEYKERKANKDKDKNLAKAIFRDKCCHKKPGNTPLLLLLLRATLGFIIFPMQFTRHKSFGLRDVFLQTYGIYVSGNKFAPIYEKF